jgi:hypothetical protein
MILAYRAGLKILSSPVAHSTAPALAGMPSGSPFRSLFMVKFHVGVEKQNNNKMLQKISK